MQVDAPGTAINLKSTGEWTGYAWFCLLLSLAGLAVVFYDGLLEMEWRWARREEYSHGYMIPFLALYLGWRRLPGLRAADWLPSWWSPVLMMAALLGWALGELSSLFIIVHYSMLLAILALALATLGRQGVIILSAAIAYLFFMIPLPAFLYNGISGQLQLISTSIGVGFMRIFDVTVFVEGNVIDLGNYQLQVVDACSGLRYLFPLMSFGFLVAVLYQGKTWHRWTIFLATVPITILMNSLRIGLIGISVQYLGMGVAEGFLHAFEGWLVFMACLAVLLLLVWLLNLRKEDGLGALDRLDLKYVSWSSVSAIEPGRRRTLPTLLVCTVMCVLAVPLSLMVTDRQEATPGRETFNTFPLLKGDWKGKESSFGALMMESLALTDYILADYRRPGDPYPVNLYAAYYESQRAGSSIHSPRTCMPGGGWEIVELDQLDLAEALQFSGLTVNRAVIQLGEHRQLVYYWFQQRGRVITNEYHAKWQLFVDGLFMARSDGALVRLVTPMTPRDEGEADQRLQAYLRDFYGDLPRYIPGG